MSEFAIINRQFTPETFRAYVDSITLPGPDGFLPQFVVIHNTSYPDLAMRPNGFTAQHMENIRYGYIHDNGWAGGPHLFVDDVNITVFNPLNKSGVHSPSWNGISWGIEMLGEYQTDAFNSGRGARVRDNTVAAAAILCRKIGADPKTIRFHKEDAKTTHKQCPGKNVVKSDFLALVQDYTEKRLPGGSPKTWSVEYDDETITPHLTETFVVRDIMAALGGTLEINDAKKIITIHPAKN